jgi:hypothetical protein
MQLIRAVQENNDVGESDTTAVREKQTISKAGNEVRAGRATALLFLFPFRLHFVATMLDG